MKEEEKPRERITKSCSRNESRESPDRDGRTRSSFREAVAVKIRTKQGGNDADREKWKAGHRLGTNTQKPEKVRAR